MLYNDTSAVKNRFDSFMLSSQNTNILSNSNIKSDYEKSLKNCDNLTKNKFDINYKLTNKINNKKTKVYCHNHQLLAKQIQTFKQNDDFKQHQHQQKCVKQQFCLNFSFENQKFVNVNNTKNNNKLFHSIDRLLSN